MICQTDCKARMLREETLNGANYGFLMIEVGDFEHFAIYIKQREECVLECIEGTREFAEQQFLYATEGNLSPCHLREWLDDLRQSQT